LSGRDALDSSSTTQPDHSKPVEDKFLVPYHRNPLFVGREKFLLALKTKLAEEVPRQFNHCVALYGVGGIGKTQCALEYVYANELNYERIYWISAVDQTSLLSGYGKIARKVDLPGLRHANPVEVAEAVLSWLRKERNWLVIIDNLDDIDVANGFLPESASQKHVLITTRNPFTMKIPAEPLEVPILDEEASVDLLLTVSKVAAPLNSAERQEAVAIVKELGYLPLAINQAAAYVREVTGEFVSFSEQYHKNRNEVHEWPPSSRHYPFSISTTWLMSFKILQENHPRAVRLLRLFSFLNPDGILIEFLQAGADAVDDELRQTLLNLNELAKTLIELEKLSLIVWDRLRRSVSIHRLVQAVVLDKMVNGELILISNIVIDIFDLAFPKEVTHETRQLCQRYEPQVVDPLLRLKPPPSEKVAFVKVRVGSFLYDDGKYKDSEKLLLQAVETNTRILGDENPYTLLSMSHLALAYKAQGRTKEAATLEENILEKSREILGEDYPFTLTIMDNLALTYQALRKTNEAITLQQNVLEKRKEILGEDHPSTLISMSNLATTYAEQGMTSKAVRLEEEILESKKKILGEDHPSTIISMDNLASTYEDLGKTEEAARLQEEALAKSKEILGENHPDTLAIMNNLALTYRSLRKNIEAASLQNKLVGESKEKLGEEHPFTLTSMSNLALTYSALGRVTEAVKLEKRVLEKREEILGEDHPDTLTSMNNLAITYAQLGETTEAVRLQEKALEKSKRIFGDEHPHTLNTKKNLDIIYQRKSM
jgi:tetratricopeptide (TPR) repeat protein